MRVGEGAGCQTVADGGRNGGDGESESEEDRRKEDGAEEQGFKGEGEGDVIDGECSTTILAVLEQLHAKGCTFDHVVITAAVDVCAVRGEVEGAFLLAGRAREWGLSPSVSVFNALLKALLIAGSFVHVSVCVPVCYSQKCSELRSSACR